VTRYYRIPGGVPRYRDILSNQLRLAIFVLLVVVGGCADAPRRSLPEASHAKAWLIERVPIGTKKSAVISYMQSHKLDGIYALHSDNEYHALPSFDSFPCSPTRNDTCSFNGGYDGDFHYKSPRTIIVSVETPSASRKFIWCDVALFIGFDQRDRVDSRKASQICTGP